MNGFNQNITSLLATPFKKSGLLNFLVHWLAWLVLHFITFLPTLLNMRKITWEPFLYTHFVVVSLNFLLFYVVAFHIMPVMAKWQKRWVWVLIASLLLAILHTYLLFRLQVAWADYIMNKSPGFARFTRKPSTEPLGFLSYRFRSYFQLHILTNVSIVVVAFAYRLLLGWFQQEKIRKELENQKLRTELSYLKMQVNPHFLFNALNNIYSLAVIENSNRTGNSILKLSELIRYMLYEKEDAESKVSLEREIYQINSYIDLEKLRYQSELYVNFSIEGDITGKRIAPLLLFPLIENAFKHGVITDPGKPVTISLKISNQRLQFSIDNYNNDYVKDKNGGIGIQNVKKRLELLYGNDFEITIQNYGGRHIVNLNLPL